MLMSRTRWFRSMDSHRTPQQFVFGKNPHIPGDLLSEPLQIVPATASLTGEGFEMEDDRAMRVALCPRRTLDFHPGDLVAYWHSQKWEKGTLNLGGRWYGTAIVMGHVGRNLVLLHRPQILRCAPEQVRFVTQEEKILVSSPQAEMLGIKDLITKGNLESKQFLDLVSESFPLVEDPHVPVSPPSHGPQDEPDRRPADVDAPMRWEPPGEETHVSAAPPTTIRISRKRESCEPGWHVSGDNYASRFRAEFNHRENRILFIRACTP